MWFLLGLFIGTLLGAVVLAAMCVAGRDDERMGRNDYP